MLILLIPIIIPVLFLLGIIFLIRRSLVTSAIFVFAAILLNLYTQTFSFHPSYFVKTTQNNKCQIKILSYNIKYNGNYLRQNTDSFSALISFLQQQKADILVLPESRLNSTSKSLRKKLDNIYPFSLGSGFDGNEFYVETYVFSRYPISNVRQYGKHYIYEMDISITEEYKIKLVACHLTSNQSHSSLKEGEGIIGNIRKGNKTRINEAQMICDSLHNHNGPIIIAGDLNDISGSKTLKILQNSLSLNDAWWKVGFGYGATSLSKHLYFRLDHILFSSHLKATSIEIPKVDFSDHYPIVTNLEIQ